MPVRLTPRETEVMDLVEKGNTPKEIADALCVGKRVVDFHLQNVYRKYNVRTRGDALRKYLRQRQQAFTLIEVLIIIAIIAMLAALLIGAARGCESKNSHYDYELGGWVIEKPDGTKFIRDGNGNVRQIFQSEPRSAQ